MGPAAEVFVVRVLSGGWIAIQDVYLDPAVTEA
jgi:hypothetical protein